MAAETSKITIHMVSSLDGFIGRKDKDISWMQSNDSYEDGITLTKEYIADYLDSIDCYVMGSQTYGHAIELGWPYGNKPVFVMTHRKLTTSRETVSFHYGNLKNIINNLVKPRYRNIWMVGGSKLTKEFLRLNLADEIIVSMMPIILGNGILFFDYINKEQKLHLKSLRAYKDGMVELCYEILK
jgi:dihydrofolate reductase